MTNAVIDNSTLSSVERVIGNISVRSAYDLSGDLAAFDAYLSVLLFYDNPVRIDDYKAEYSEARARAFPEIGTVKFEDGSYEQFLSAARELSQSATLGSGLIDHSQKMTVAAIAMADMKVWAQRS
jgi:hypothetical protein